MAGVKDKVGQVFGRLTVICRDETLKIWYEEAEKLTPYREAEAA